MDWSGLAQLAPVLAAGFTKNPGTVMNTINMTDKGKEAAYQRNLRDFGRELFSSGQIPDAQQVVALANKHGVRPADAMSTINNFMSWRQKRQQMKQADQAYQRGELDLTQTRNTMDRQQAQQELLGQYGDMPKQEFFAEAVKRGLVKPSPYGEMQGGLRPGTVSAMNYQTGLPEVLQNPAPTRQRANYQITSRGIFDPNAGRMIQEFPQQAAGGGGKGQQFTPGQAQEMIMMSIPDMDKANAAQMELVQMVSQGYPVNLALNAVLQKYTAQTPGPGAPGQPGGNVGQSLLNQFLPNRQQQQPKQQAQQPAGGNGGGKYMRYSRTKGWY